jgi:hypothetical protein
VILLQLAQRKNYEDVYSFVHRLSRVYECVRVYLCVCARAYDRTTTTPCYWYQYSVLTECRADFGQGPGHTSKCPYNQSPITNHRYR